MATIRKISTDDNVSIALHCVGNSEHPPVLLIPGTFSNHTFWLGTKGIGFARTLAEQGYYACVLDPRGHGHSERPSTNQRWDIDDWARHDFPAALRAISSNERPAHVVAHSAGGAVALAGLSAHPELHALVKSIVAIGTPLPWLQPWRGIAARLIRRGSLAMRGFPAKILMLGPEDELPHVMAQWMTWNLEGHWTGDDGTDYTAGLGAIRHPFLMIAGTADRLFAPPNACRGLYELIGSEVKEFEIFEGLDHVRLVVSREAQARVWPKILSFVKLQG
ncbi:MAG TPA: alpha/beta fold hydrolase [Longimicrobiales bacterium]|nr:alpha/beta fold hydrolase [Longimicrobiales bacterium]